MRGFIRNDVSRRIGRLLKGRDFMSAALVLVSGTVLAQLVVLVTLPILTRLYTPDDFAVLAVYMAIVAIFSSAASLGFDMAIPLPESNDDAMHLLGMALICSVGVSALVALVLCFNDFLWIDSAVLVRLQAHIWVLPLGIFCVAAFGAIQFYAVRQKAFLELSKARFWQSVVGVSVQGAVALAGWVPGALLIGQLVGSSSGALFLLRDILFAGRGQQWQVLSLSRIRALAREYRRFPQYTTFESLANNLGIQLPIILIAILVAGVEAGFLMLAMRVMQAPIGMVGGAVGQVYLSRVSEQQKDGDLSSFTLTVLLGLARVGVGPIVFIGVISPGLFELLFGAGWFRAGELVMWMTPWFVLQYLASPISMVMHVQQQQRMMLLLTCFGLIVRVGTLLGCAILLPTWLSEVYALSGAVFYCVCFVLFTRVAGIGYAAQVSVAVQLLLIGALGGTAGLLVNYLVEW